MDFAIGGELRLEVKESVERELGREMTTEELNIFYRTSRIALIKGEQQGRFSGEERRMA